MHIFMTEREAFLNISGVFLAAKNRYDAEGGWNLEAEISYVQSNFEGIDEASSKDGVVRIEHVDNIKGDVFCAGFCGVPKETGKVMTATSSILFPPKP
jgi:hypothetical protein